MGAVSHHHQQHDVNQCCDKGKSQHRPCPLVGGMVAVPVGMHAHIASLRLAEPRFNRAKYLGLYTGNADSASKVVGKKCSSSTPRHKVGEPHENKSNTGFGD